MIVDTGAYPEFVVDPLFLKAGHAREVHARGGVRVVV